MSTIVTNGWDPVLPANKKTAATHRIGLRLVIKSDFLKGTGFSPYITQA